MSGEVKAPQTGTVEVLESASNGGKKVLYALILLGTLCIAAVTYVVLSKPKVSTAC